MSASRPESLWKRRGIEWLAPDPQLQMWHMLEAGAPSELHCSPPSVWLEPQAPSELHCSPLSVWLEPQVPSELYCSSPSVQPWSWWSFSSLGASSCLPISPHSSMWRALPWCWGLHSSVASAGPLHKYFCRKLNWVSPWGGLGVGQTGQQARSDNVPCRVLQAFRIPLTPCSTCSRSCSWDSSLSLPYLKVRSVFYL